MAAVTGKTPCKYGPVFALCLYRIESNRVNTVQKRVRIYMAFFLCVVGIDIPGRFGLRIEARHRNQPNKSKLLLYYKPLL